jgi:hypothetical protein
MKIDVKIEGLQRLREGIKDFSERRLRSIVATALTRTAVKMRDDWTGQLASEIDRPTARTKGAAGIVGAKADSLKAVVFLKDKMAGTAPAQYLSPLEFGGARFIKKFEQALISSGAMPAGYLTVPGKGAVRDGYGNVSRAQLVAVIRALGTQYSPGYQRVISASTAKRLRSQARHGRRYIAIQPGGVAGRSRISPGIYERMPDRSLKAIFIFKSDVKYKRRLSLLGRESVEGAERYLAQEIKRATSESLARLAARGAR